MRTHQCSYAWFCHWSWVSLNSLEYLAFFAYLLQMWNMLTSILAHFCHFTKNLCAYFCPLTALWTSSHFQRYKVQCHWNMPVTKCRPCYSVQVTNYFDLTLPTKIDWIAQSAEQKANIYRKTFEQIIFQPLMREKVFGLRHWNIVKIYTLVKSPRNLFWAIWNEVKLIDI